MGYTLERTGTLTGRGRMGDVEEGVVADEVEPGGSQGRNVATTREGKCFA